MANDVKKYLGVDWGEKRIGLALGDSATKMAVPFKVVRSLKEAADCIKNEGIDEVVIGMPFKMGGLDKKISGEFELFFNKFKKESSVPVVSMDERLSSKAADALAGDRKTKAPRDALAAMIILQSYLDQKEG